MINKELIRLMRCFPHSFINCNYEIIIDRKTNHFFKLDNITDEIELKYKVLEWLSGPAFKTYRNNKKFNNFMIIGINEFLDTDFTADEMQLIYQELGNNINRPLTEKFVQSEYDLKILITQEDKNGK